MQVKRTRTPAAPNFWYIAINTYEEPTYPVWVSIFHFLRCNYVCRSGVSVW